MNSPLDLLALAARLCWPGRAQAASAAAGKRTARLEPLEQRHLLTLSLGDVSAAVAESMIFVPPGEKPALEAGGDHAPGFNNSGLKWPQPGGAGNPTTITYSYNNMLDGGLGGNLTAAEIRFGVEEALGLWAQYAPINFIERQDSGPPPSTSSYSAGGHPQLRIGHRFIDGNAGQNTLAVAYFPGSNGLAGDIHFDNGNTWNDVPRGGIDLIEVMTHELGHALGLGHENGTTAIMGSFYRGVFNGPDTGFLYTDDINGIRAIYGTGVGSVQPLLQAPTAVDDEFVVEEDGLLTDSVVSNDTDPDGSLLSATLVNGTTHGELTLNRDGSFQYVPEPDFFGTDTFGYRVRNRAAQSNLGTVTIHVRPTLDPPVAVDDAFSMPQDSVLLTGLPVETVIEPGESWQYLDDGTDQRSAWREADFDDSLWRAGNAPLGYGDGDEATLVRFGNNPADKHITTYFRRDFELTAAAGVTEIAVRLLRDDGAAVYINGNEVVRDNLIERADSRTPSQSPTVGSAETTFFQFDLEADQLPRGTLREGTNTVAVEVHLEGPTSPDLSFDLGLDVVRNNGRALSANDLDPDQTGLQVSIETAPQSGELELSADGAFRYQPTPGFFGRDSFTYRLRGARPATLVAAGSPWSYLDDGSNQQTAWRAADFDDSTWRVGAAPLGYGDGDEFTVVDFGDDPSQKHATTYFRKSFRAESGRPVERLTAQLLRDDAAAVYLNGVEVYRDQSLPDNAGYDTFARFRVEDENAFVSFPIDAELLVDGENVLAVEVHQHTGASTDVSFDFSLAGLVTSQAATVTIDVVPDLLGDTNGDGVVDIVDLNNVRNHFGQIGQGVLGDTNGDNVVDIVDLNNVRNEFGRTADRPQQIEDRAQKRMQDVGGSVNTGVVQRQRFRDLRRLQSRGHVDARFARLWDAALTGVLDDVTTPAMSPSPTLPGYGR